MDVSIDDEPIGQLTIGLFGEDSPKTVENFRQICMHGINGKTYAGTKFHRSIDKLIIQGFFRKYNFQCTHQTQRHLKVIIQLEEYYLFLFFSIPALVW